MRFYFSPTWYFEYRSSILSLCLLFVLCFHFVLCFVTEDLAWRFVEWGHAPILTFHFLNAKTLVPETSVQYLLNQWMTAT